MVIYCSREDGNRCGAAHTKRAESSWIRSHNRRKDEVTGKGKDSVKRSDDEIYMNPGFGLPSS